MLKYMTKKEFKEAIDQRRFAVNNVKGNKFEVRYISNNVDGEGVTQFGLVNVINPDTKDGLFNQTGGGYNKYHACIEDIAYYVDKHAPYDEELEGFSCGAYFGSKQRLIEM